MSRLRDVSRHSDAAGTKLAIADSLREMDDLEFLAEGSITTMNSCPIPRWHLLIAKQDCWDGSAFCGICEDCNCTGEPNDDDPKSGCNPSNGRFHCSRSYGCECAAQWDMLNWPQARLDSFRRWIIRQIETSAKAMRERIKQTQNAAREGTPFADVVMAGIPEGRKYQSKYYKPV